MSESTAEALSKVLVAQYLAKHGHEATLLNFLQETGLARSTVEAAHYEDLETVIAERIAFNEHAIVSKLAETSLNDAIPALDTRFQVASWDYRQKLVQQPLLEKVPGMAIDVRFCAETDAASLAVSTSARSVCFYDQSYHILKELKSTKGPVKKCGALADSKFYYACGFDGTISIYNAKFERVIHHQLHARIVTDIDFWRVDDSNTRFQIFSCGLDNYVKLHILDLNTFSIELAGSQKLLTPCTSFQLAQVSSESNFPVLFLTRADFSHVLVFGAVQNRLVEICKIALNSAKFSAHSFNARSTCLIDFGVKNTPTSQVPPEITKSSMLAIATSHTPFMRLILLSIPEFDLSGLTNEESVIVHYDKIIRNMATCIPQDQYSQPIVKPFTQANGLIVGSDTGVYGADLRNCDFWRIMSEEKRVKAMDVLNGQIAVSYAGGDLELWHANSC